MRNDAQHRPETTNRRDLAYVRRALALAARGRGHVHPNPLVGAVVVKDDVVVGEGWHARFGGDHAEVVALTAAGERAQGAALYVTLEPCCVHGKTPPCTEAVIAAGITRVVAATADPNPLVSGRGFDRLREAGVDVSMGLDADAATRLNAPFFCHQLRGRAHLTVKVGASLDGRIADLDGHSRWITGDESRAQAHRMRAACDVIAVGRGTIVADDPALTVRHVEGRDPVRMIFDGRGRVPATARAFADGGRTVHVTLPGETSAASGFANVEHWEVEPRFEGGPPCVGSVLERCAQRGWIDVLVEGGGTLVSSCFQEGVVDRAQVFLAPLVVGNRDAIGWADAIGRRSLDEADRLQIADVRRYGDDVMIELDSLPSARRGEARAVS